jgi:glycosyltransferase involved in cell wall biosynthesis
VLVSIICAVKDGSPLIVEQLASIAAQKIDVPFELIIADNGSTDGTLDDVRPFSELGFRLRVIDASAVAGKQYAQRVGVDASEGDLLVFVDHDDVCSAGWLQALVATSADFDMVGGRMDISSLNDQRAIQARPYADTGTEGLAEASGGVPYAIGGNAAIWRETYYRIQSEGLLPVLAAEDRDAGYRLRRAGLKIGFAAEAVVSYRLRRPGKALRTQMRDYGRADALLVKRYRDLGARGDRPGLVVRKYAQLLPRAAKAMIERDEVHWSRNELAVALGRLEGSVKFRVVCL